MVEAGATVIEIVPGPQFDDPSLPLVAGSGEAVLATQGAKLATLLADSGCAVPIILGGRIVSPLGAEAALAVAGIDAVSIGRALIADPAWLAKIRAGIDSEIVPCIGCLACLEHSETRLNLEGPADRLASFALDGRIGCVTNGDAGHEATSTTDATSPRRITVLGTGLPGLEFARVAASRGHEVTIVPDSYPLGGITGLRAGVPGNAELGRAPLSAFERLRRIGVTVSATTPPDADFTVDARPPPVLPVDWGSGRNVLRAAEVLGRDLHQMYGIGRRVAVCGPGALTAEVALFLAGWGRRPTVIVPGSLADPFPDVHPMYAARLRERLFGYKCELVTGATAQEWRDARDRKSHLVVRRDDGEATLGPFQTAVDCRGWDAPRVTGSHGAVVGDATLASELRVLVRAATNLARLL
jgi:NADPH-dependent 2,4-dienoyl-CoA reductase/sulfur reductase-like enzyme